MDTDTPTAPEGQGDEPMKEPKEKPISAWRLTLGDPDESTGKIPVGLTGTKNRTPTWDAPLLRRDLTYKYMLFSDIDPTREDTSEPLFLPGTLENLIIGCPVCGNALTVINRPKPRILPPCPDPGLWMGRCVVICKSCYRASRMMARKNRN